MGTQPRTTPSPEAARIVCCVVLFTLLFYRYVLSSGLLWRWYKRTLQYGHRRSVSVAHRKRKHIPHKVWIDCYSLLRFLVLTNCWANSHATSGHHVAARPAYADVAGVGLRRASTGSIVWRLPSLRANVQLRSWTLPRHMVRGAAILYGHRAGSALHFGHLRKAARQFAVGEQCHHQSIVSLIRWPNIDSNCHNNCAIYTLVRAFSVWSPANWSCWASRAKASSAYSTRRCRWPTTPRWTCWTPITNRSLCCGPATASDPLDTPNRPGWWHATACPPARSCNGPTVCWTNSPSDERSSSRQISKIVIRRRNHWRHSIPPSRLQRYRRTRRATRTFCVLHFSITFFIELQFILKKIFLEFKNILILFLRRLRLGFVFRCETYCGRRRTHSMCVNMYCQWICWAVLFG